MRNDWFLKCYLTPAEAITNDYSSNQLEVEKTDNDERLASEDVLFVSNNQNNYIQIIRQTCLMPKI